MRTPIEILLDPMCAVNYASFYVRGIRDLFPNTPIRWKSNGFPDVFHNLGDFRHGMGGIVKYEGNAQIKIYIDFHDSDRIMDAMYEWCDVYGKINVKARDLRRNKLVTIGPGFGIVCSKKVTAVLGGIYNYFKLNKRRWRPSFKEYIRGYLYPFARRLDYSEYVKSAVPEYDYVFAASTLWYDFKTDKTTNKWRIAFTRLCKSPMPRFEGGLFYINSPAVLSEFPEYTKYKEENPDLILSKRIPMGEYMENTRKSAFVFNTPSVAGCHGWKLAEYLAMGKAIISTPLENEMPGEFRVGEEYLEVTSVEELESLILKLRQDTQLIERLSNNASAYFQKWLTPASVMERLISIAQMRKA